jgi:hypothetical protein
MATAALMRGKSSSPMKVKKGYRAATDQPDRSFSFVKYVNKARVKAFAHHRWATL